MSEKKPQRWVRNVGDSKVVMWAGMDNTFPGNQAILVNEDLAQSAQYRYAPQLEMVSEEQAAKFNARMAEVGPDREAPAAEEPPPPAIEETPAPPAPEPPAEEKPKPARAAAKRRKK